MKKFVDKCGGFSFLQKKFVPSISFLLIGEEDVLICFMRRDKKREVDGDREKIIFEVRKKIKVVGMKSIFSQDSQLARDS